MHNTGEEDVIMIDTDGGGGRGERKNTKRDGSNSVGRLQIDKVWKIKH
jgi:N-methylhydantoinase B/oxoprolinase/acetone carboxylase alpha subunit